MTSAKAPEDGRRKRSRTSRDSIVAAMLSLVEEGAITPSAEQVAARAQVGLRTVFRHFKDMESLYAAMTLVLARQYEDWLAPFAAQDWNGQLDQRRLSGVSQPMSGCCRSAAPVMRIAISHRQSRKRIIECSP